MTLALTGTAQAVAGIFSHAQERVHADTTRFFHKAHEETITTLFHLRLHEAFAEPGAQYSVQQAFDADLREAFPNASPEATSNVAGQIATSVVWHPRHVEAKTGGDFALAFAVPALDETGYPARFVMRRQGLVVQAKRRHGDGFGRLSSKQGKMLPKSAKFTGLVFYDFERGKGDAGFGYQLLKGWSVPRVRAALATGSFDAPPLPIGHIFAGLADGSVGTADPAELEQYVRPEEMDRLEIEVFWASGEPPAPDLLTQWQVQAVEEPQRLWLSE